MKTLVVYYSFTGNTRRVAQLLAEELGADIAEVTCPRYSYGRFGGLRQAWDIFTGGLPPVEAPDELGRDYDLIVAAGPVWAARPGPPIRSLVRNLALKGRKLVLFLTCDGTSEKYPGEKALDELVRLAPAQPIARHLFKRADVEAADLPQRVKAFADEIRTVAA